MQIDIHPAAEAEVEAAMQWYEDQRASLGVEFNEGIDAVLDQIEGRPQSGWKYGDLGHRVLPLKRFPYFIYFSVDETVIAFTQSLTNSPTGLLEGAAALNGR